MRRFFLVLLVVALFTVVDAASTSSIRKLTPVAPSNDLPDKRLLRIKTKREKDNGEDERAITVPDLSKLSKVQEWPSKMKGWRLSKVKEWIKDNLDRFKAWYADYKQVKAWTKEKKTPDEVFKLLELDQNIDTVLNSPKLTTWARFLLSYNKKSENDVTLLGTLTKFYGNEPLAKMLERSRWNSDTRPLASGLQNAQLTAWQGNGLTTDIVYSMLKVGDQSMEKLLANPNLHVWTYFSFRRTAHDPENYVYMVKKLMTSYDEMELAKAIQVATKDKMVTEFIAKRLQTAQFKLWKEEGRTPKGIFKMLNVDTKKWPYDPNVEVYRAYKLYLL